MRTETLRRIRNCQNQILTAYGCISYGNLECNTKLLSQRYQATLSRIQKKMILGKMKCELTNIMVIEAR